MASNPTTVLAVEAADLTKVYGGTTALAGASVRIRPGEVHALLGENGAGKSTMVRILSGLARPDSGTLALSGQAVRLHGPRDAQAAGIQTAFQEMTLVGDLTVLENMLMPKAPTGPFGTIRRRAGRAAVAACFDRLALSSIPLDAEVRGLDLPVRQKIEIARAIFRQPRVLLLDEPTSSLSGRDVDWLGDRIAALKADGVTVVFISHRLSEVRAFCDRLTVLRNGKDVVTGDTSEFDDDALVRQIAGRSISQVFPARPAAAPAAAAPPALRVEGLRAGRAEGVSLQLARGEILGIAGLQGMGQLDLFLALYGMAERRAGQFECDGRAVSLDSPGAALSAGMGISLVPEDRKTEALFLGLDGTLNAALPVLPRFVRRGLLDMDAVRRSVAGVFRRMKVDERALWTRVGAFSGGNQQKIAIAKWLLAQSRILLLYDPTRGIDVGTKHEIYRLMRDFAAEGGSILFYSTEVSELVHMADRVLVLYQGRVAAEFSQGEIGETSILAAALGGLPEKLLA